MNTYKTTLGKVRCNHCDQLYWVHKLNDKDRLRYCPDPKDYEPKGDWVLHMKWCTEGKGDEYL